MQKYFSILTMDIQAYIGDMVTLIPDHHDKANNAIKLITRIFGFPSVYENYVYTVFQSTKCAIALCL